MAVRPPTGFSGLSRRSRLLIGVGVAVLVLLFGGSRFISTYVDWLWFGEVGYRGVFTTVVLTRVVLFLVVGLAVGAVVAGGLLLAYRSRPVFVPVSGPDDPVARYRTTVMGRPKLFGIGIPVVIGLVSGLVAQNSWTTVQLFLNGTTFDIRDPQFGYDVGFYAFDLPFIRSVLNWVFVALVLAFLANLVTHYLFGGLRLAGRGGQLTRAARVQLAVLAGTFVLAKAVAYWFDRYSLLSSDRKAPTFTGASYTDLNAVLPAKLIMLSIAVVVALAFFAGIVLRDLRVPALATALLIFSSILVGAAWPAVVEQFQVRPNAASLESTPIERNIAATREAYGLTDQQVTYESYPGNATVAPSDVAADEATVSNIRLLDPRVLTSTFTQQQQLKNFYGFPDSLNVDRYEVDGELRDYVVAARELNPAELTGNQTDWINRHTVYTHGNGFVAAPANQVNAAVEDQGSSTGGYPVYTVSDLASQGAIPLDQPRSYYGPLIGAANPDYAIVGGAEGQPPREYDTDTSTYTYTGSGGVPVGSLLNKLVFASQYAERNILFSGAVASDSKIIFKRDPRDRVQAVAPWLTTDGGTYPAVVDGRLKWIVDGYTTLDNFPYAQSTSLEDLTLDSSVATINGVRALPSREVSYIRNSVKATVDAYDGTVSLYSVDDTDPVLKAWEGVFPGVVKPSSEVSDELRAHFRYPEDLFKVQRELLARYHVSNPLEFFTTNAFWSVPSDPTIDNNSGRLAQPPYYVLASDPATSKTSFQLTSALVGLNREFLSAYMTVSSNPEDYGQITVLQLPTDTQSQGPQQVQNTMISAPQVSQELNLLRQQSTRILYGNLLTLPVGEGGLLYVEPVYIERTGQSTSFPQLARVLVSYNGQVGFAPTLAQALDQVFGSGAGSTTVVPPTEGGTPDTGSATPTPTTTAPPAAAGSVAAAVTELNTAIASLQQAQSSGDFGAYGQALTRLQQAVADYQAVSGQSASSAPTTVPVPTTAAPAPASPAPVAPGG